MGKEFQVNEYISLRREDRKTYIYLKGEKFNQCKYILFQTPLLQALHLEKINSVDKLEERLNHSNENDYKIEPEIEFWAHSKSHKCDLQVFV